MAEILFNCKVFNFTQAKFKEVYGAEDILQRFLLSPERLDCFGDRRVVLALGQIMVQCLDKDPIRRPKLDWVAISLKLILTTCAG